MPQTPRLHNLRENKSQRSPRRWLFFDTETRPEVSDDGERHRLLVWTAWLIERDFRARARPRWTAWAGRTTAELVSVIEDACRGGERLWICAHNLGFDLAVTALPLALANAGWRVTDHGLAGSSPWLRLARGSRHLTIVDSLSWLPASLEQLAAWQHIPHVELPAWEANEQLWIERCRADVGILAYAMLRLLDWWDANALGHWSLTGPGCGFNSYRHRGFKSPVVIDPEPAARALERRAIYGGRAECWRVGELPAGRYALIDFAHAFASVCAELRLPRRRGVAFDTLPLDHRALTSPLLDLLAEVEVETASPRYPLRTPYGVVHPVGRFRTTLACPEIREAARRGELRRIGAGHFYVLSDHMSGWARWAIEVIDSPDSTADPVVRCCVKAWTRSVPGRWAGRTSRTVKKLEQPVPGWHLERGKHLPAGVPVTVLDLAGWRYWLDGDVDMDHAFPAILAWVQSYVRVRLGRLLDSFATSDLVLCNTDGLWLDLEAWSNDRGAVRWDRLPVSASLANLDAHLGKVAPALFPLRPELRNWSNRLDVLSPQHVVTDTTRQLSGVPRGAQALGGHRYRFLDWPKLSTHLQADDPDAYQRRLRTVDLSSVPVLRWVLADGTTRPLTVLYDPERGNELLPLQNGHTAPYSITAAPLQHPGLTAMLGGTHGQPV